MAMNKKAYYFSLSVLIMLVLVYIFFSAHRDPGISRQSLVVEQRLQELNRIINLVEKDAEIGLRIATFRTIMDLDNNVSSGDYIHTDNFSDIASELLYNGSIEGVPGIFSKNNSLIDWENQTKQLFKAMGAQANYSFRGANLTQRSPWHVVSYYNVTLVVEDFFTSSNWTKDIDVVIELEIANFFDPLYSIKTFDRKNINKFPDGEDISNLSEIISGGYYVASNNSPGFLQRFQNVSVMNVNDFVGVGIESLVNRTQGTFPNHNDRPLIDWLYFYDEGTPCRAPGGYLLAVGFNNTYGVNCN